MNSYNRNKYAPAAHSRLVSSCTRARSSTGFKVVTTSRRRDGYAEMSEKRFRFLVTIKSTVKEKKNGRLEDIRSSVSFGRTCFSDPKVTINRFDDSERNSVHLRGFSGFKFRASENEKKRICIIA